jgi:energy-coupling factor transporter ATP-binding protein EcfA2
MELVYLWVEGYKNINHQGFNFSPRFEFEYIQEKNELILKKENKDYVSIFPKNINITAIVGENGSGKSGVLEFLRFALKNDRDDEKYKSLILFFDKKTTRYTLLNLLNTKIKTIPIITQKCYQGINSFEKILSKTIFPTFDYSLTYNLLDYNKDKNKVIKYHFPFYPDKIIKIDLKEEVIKNQEYILLNYMTLKKKNQLNKFEKFFQPNVINIYFDLSTMSLNENCELKDNKKDEYTTLRTDIQGNLDIPRTIERIYDLSVFLSNQSNYNDKPLAEINFGNDFKMCERDNFKLGRDDTAETKSNNIFDIKPNGKKLLEKNKIDYFEYESTLLLSFEIDSLNDQDIKQIMASFSSRQFKIELIDKNNKKLNDLSFGEQQLLNFLNSLYYLGSKEYTFLDINDDTHSKDIKSFIVFFDEIELGLHPNWQKRTVHYILDFLQLIPDRNFHLILASHSPFLLSDLPKENVIFLDKDKDGNCKVVDGLKEKKQTFGANIHTLLSDSFFMEDGLMGEFAKVKIQSIIKYHEDIEKKEIIEADKIEYKAKQQKEFWQIQSIIGDDYLKQVIKNHLIEIEKIVLGNDDAKNEEVKRLKAQIELLEK